MSDIVDALRREHDILLMSGMDLSDPLLTSAEEIKRLRARVAELETTIAEANESADVDVLDGETLAGRIDHLVLNRHELARQITKLQARVAELEAEAFKLAANQCHNGYGAENGDHRCKYQDRVAELEAGQAWMPIESAPKDGTQILTRYEAMSVTELTWWTGDRWVRYGGTAQPDLWMPLPPPPKGPAP